jgi:hypothetical protein
LCLGSRFGKGWEMIARSGGGPMWTSPHGMDPRRILLPRIPKRSLQRQDPYNHGLIEGSDKICDFIHDSMESRVIGTPISRIRVTRKRRPHKVCSRQFCWVFQSRAACSLVTRDGIRSWIAFGSCWRSSSLSLLDLKLRSITKYRALRYQRIALLIANTQALAHRVYFVWNSSKPSIRATSKSV